MAEATAAAAEPATSEAAGPTLVLDVDVGIEIVAWDQHQPPFGPLVKWAQRHHTAVFRSIEGYPNARAGNPTVGGGHDGGRAAQERGIPVQP